MKNKEIKISLILLSEEYTPSTFYGIGAVAPPTTQPLFLIVIIVIIFYLFIYFFCSHEQQTGFRSSLPG